MELVRPVEPRVERRIQLAVAYGKSGVLSLDFLSSYNVSRELPFSCCLPAGFISFYPRLEALNSSK
jgi:hypothetical protein